MSAVETSIQFVWLLLVLYFMTVGIWCARKLEPRVARVPRREFAVFLVLVGVLIYAPIVVFLIGTMVKVVRG